MANSKTRSAGRGKVVRWERGAMAFLPKRPMWENNMRLTTAKVEGEIPLKRHNFVTVAKRYGFSSWDEVARKIVNLPRTKIAELKKNPNYEICLSKKVLRKIDLRLHT